MSLVKNALNKPNLQSITAYLATQYIVGYWLCSLVIVWLSGSLQFTATAEYQKKVFHIFHISLTWEKDQNLKFKAQFLLSACQFCTIRKLKL
jgi:hypothetical protein